MAKHGAKGLNIFRSHRKNSYTTVSASFFGLLAVQSSRDTRWHFTIHKNGAIFRGDLCAARGTLVGCWDWSKLDCYLPVLPGKRCPRIAFFTF